MRTPSIDVPCGPPPAKGAPPGDAPPDTAFAAVLEARTAPAEGQTTEPNDGFTADETVNPSLGGPAVEISATVATSAAAPAAPAEAPAASAPGAAAAEPAAPAPGAAPAQPATPSPAGTTPQAPAAPGATVAAEASVTIGPGEPTEPADPAASEPTPPTAAAPGATDEPADPAGPKERTAPGRPEWAQGHGPERAAEVHERNDARQAERAEPAAPASPAAPQRAEGPATPAQPAAPAASAAAAHRAVVTPESTSSTLTARIEQVHALVRLAREHGAAHARVELHPADLGRIDVVLRQTPDGLVASVGAHDAAAVAVLETAGADLRRALEDRGVTVARVDVALSDHGAGERRADHAGTPGRPGRRNAGPDASDPTDPTTLDPAPTTLALGLGAGALVDVRA